MSRSQRESPVCFAFGESALVLSTTRTQARPAGSGILPAGPLALWVQTPALAL